MMTQGQKLQIKFKFDKLLDDVFFTSDFRDFIVRVMHHCPSGLTIDTDIEGNEPCFKVCTKQYGYNHPSRERVPGDYYNLNYKVDEEMAAATYFYLENATPDLYNEIKETGYKMYL